MKREAPRSYWRSCAWSPASFWCRRIALRNWCEPRRSVTFLEATILGENRYAVGTVLDAIKKARNKVLLGKPEVEGDAQ